MGYVGIDTQGARRVGQALVDASARADDARQQAIGALTLAELDSDVPAQLGIVSDGLSILGLRVAQRADLAERFTADPLAVAASLGTPTQSLPVRVAAIGAGTLVSPPDDSLSGSSRNDALSGGAGQDGLADTMGFTDGFTLAFELPPAGAVAGMPGLTVTTPGPAVPTIPAYGTPGVLFPLMNIAVPGQQVLKIAIVGDSFLSGEGADVPPFHDRSYATNLGPKGGYFDEFGYHERDPEPIVSSIHQSSQAGAVQAVRLLQAQHPDATIRITYSGNGNTTTLTPLTSNGDGPLLEVSFVAESGATSQSILGKDQNRTDSPSQAQIEAVRNADIVILSTGGNDAKVADTIKAAVGKVSIYDGTKDIQSKIDAISSRTANVPDVLRGIIDMASPIARVLVLGYPNILTPLLPDGTPEPLSPGVNWWSRNINAAELGLITRFGATLNETLAGYARETTPLPGQSITFLPQWGHWFRPDTLGSPTTGVNDFNMYYFSESYHPNRRGQQMIASELLQPLEAAVAGKLGRPAPLASDPASHFFALAAAATDVNWDDLALTSVAVPGLTSPDLSAPGLSVADPAALRAAMPTAPVAPMTPSIVDTAMDPSTWATPAPDFDWNAVDLNTVPADIAPSWDSGMWGGSTESYDMGGSVSVMDYL